LGVSEGGNGMKIRLALAALAAICTTALVAAPGALAQPPAAAQGIPLPVTSCVLPGGGACTVQLTGFEVIGGTANAVLNVVNSAGNVVSTVTAPLTAITGAANAACTILDLTIGPIHLDLLGLVIDTNMIHLTITAVPGAGNLLGNLLCGVAHLLDNPSQQLTGVVNLLNNLLRHGATGTAAPAV
jgi:hypothetical protein